MGVRVRSGEGGLWGGGGTGKSKVKVRSGRGETGKWG